MAGFVKIRRVLEVILLLQLVHLVVVLGKKLSLCDRVPIHTTAPRTAGDHGFTIYVKGLPAEGKYTPGQTYSVIVKNSDERIKDKSFLGLMLVAVPAGAKDESTTVGNFSEPTDHVKAAEGCDHTVVVHHYLDKKKKIKVEWTAPSYGCVELRATVIGEHAKYWYKDDGNLTLKLCEDSISEAQGDATSQSDSPQCCACGEARYKMVFQGLWSKQTHPKGFPTGRDFIMDKRPLQDVTASSRYQQWNGQSAPVKNPQKRKLKTEPSAVRDVYFSSCCPKKCLNGLSMEDIQRHRDQYWELSGKQQRTFIYQQVKNSYVDGVLTFCVDGTRLCEVSWLKLFGIADRRYRDIKKTVIAKQPMRTNDDIPRANRPSRRHLQASTWFTKYVSLFGDRQPDKVEIHLPECLTKENIYGQYKDELDKAKEPVLSLSAFRDLWLKEFPYVKIATGKSGQPTCSQCTNCKALLLKNLSKETRLKTLEKLDAHLKLQALCRSKYYKHIKKARENPASYVSLIIDNMDQAKTRLPRFAVYSKADVHLTKIQHHVTGVKVHSSNRTNIFTWTDLFHSDSNITMNCLVHVLEEICKENKGYMPPTLYLQADNSTKDNKNAYMMTFLAWLVKNKVFKKVKLSFLMVGHTHEDIDQVFSRISSGMARQDAHTLPQLLERIATSTTPQPKCLHLKSLYDYKGKMPLAPGLIEKIMQPHVYKFEEIDGEVVMFYKDWPKQEEAYRSLILTRFVSSLDSPAYVKANSKIDDAITKMTRDLPKWAENGRLEQSELAWWRIYLSTISREVRLHPEVHRAQDLGRFKVPEVLEESSELENLVGAVDKSREKERRVTVLKLKKR